MSHSIQKQPKIYLKECMLLKGGKVRETAKGLARRKMHRTQAQNLLHAAGYGDTVVRKEGGSGE